MHGFDTQLRLLFATDLSERSDRAFDRALLLARHNRAHLIVLSVVDEALPDPIRVRLSQDAQDFIQEQFTAAKLRDQADIEMRIVRGRDYQTIIDQSRDGNVHLVILGVHRTDALIDTFIGATMDRVLSYGDRPVLVVKTKARRAYANVLVATDFSSASRHALEFTVRLFPQAKITLFHAHQQIVIVKSMRRNREFEKLLDRRRAALAAMAADVSKGMAQELGTAEFTVTPVFEEGMPLMAISRQLERDRLDLVVVGTHGRSRLREAMIGSTAKTVLSRIRCDVLAVPPANHD